MSEVKRYDIREYVNLGTQMAESASGDYILASDYDAREAKWKEVVRELIDRHCGGCDGYDHHNKAIAMLNDQPQEDKSHDTT